jgi:hypothetical protein
MRRFAHEHFDVPFLRQMLSRTGPEHQSALVTVGGGVPAPLRLGVNID